MLDSWNKLPESLKEPVVRLYYVGLEKKKVSLMAKRAFDLFFSVILLIVLAPVMLIVALLINRDSNGPVFYLQTRVTKNNKDFHIIKFRTMVINADKLGSQVTVSNDSRVTVIGKFLRKYRLDEFPQLINILKGEMSFVGTRPEVRKYVDIYTSEMKATLLLPAGVTSLASIVYKDEMQLLNESKDIDRTYIEEILPEKMKYNLKYLEKFSVLEDIKILLKTVKEIVF